MQKSRIIIVFIYLSLSMSVFSQTVYELDPKYPVHDLQKELLYVADSTQGYTYNDILKDSTLEYSIGVNVPKYLNVGTTYWAKLRIKARDSLKGWRLHLEDKLIGMPAWSKSNGKVDVYAFLDNELIFNKKTGVEYSKKERDIKDNWVLNQVSLDDLPPHEAVTLIIKSQGHDLGHPPYFNITARSPEQPYYHQIYQFHNSFNIFMFGVTFIIFLYHLLQYIYLRESVYMWFTIWLLFCMLTFAMTIGLIIGSFTKFRYIIWVLLANGIFYSFWFFGRVFINSKEKFPRLDKFMLGLALFVLVEIIGVVLYVALFKPQTFFTGVGIHYNLLQLYTIASLILSFILAFKKDQFARYFGIGSIIGSAFLIIGTLWAMQLIRPSSEYFVDPFATGMFLQIIIYSFGIAYRQQVLAKKSQLEKLQAQQSKAEVERIKDLDEIKSRFFANISHEFRTPLTLIKGPLKQVLRKQNTNSTESVTMSQKSFQLINNSTDRLENLVEQLLDLSKIESGKVHLSLKQGGIIQFLRSIIFSFESLAERSNIALNTSFPSEIDSAFYDKDKLEKIMSNILSNAFKYTSNMGSVTVTVDFSDKYLIVDVTDTGKGINQKDINRIFDRFYRVESNQAKGSGIGLALTKELVELHNGTISVDSTKNIGTTFKVRLPVTLDELPKSISLADKSTALDVTESPSFPLNYDEIFEDQPEETENLPVALVVEDNADLRNYITDVLKMDYMVLNAADGDQGERMAIEHIPDIVISDVMMPKKDGYELCHALKINPKTSHIPLIMLTAKAGQEHMIEGLTQGADAYVTKPFDDEELLLRMKNLINARKKIWDHFKALDMLLVNDIEVSSIDDKFLQDVFRSIKDNIDNETFRVEDIARQVGFSRSQLHRKLKALSDKSANQLIIEIRMNEAHRMLKLKAGTVSEIAYSVGYSNLSYFTKSFKERFGELPSKV